MDQNQKNLKIKEMYSRRQIVRAALNSLPENEYQNFMAELDREEPELQIIDSNQENKKQPEHRRRRILDQNY